METKSAVTATVELREYSVDVAQFRHPLLDCHAIPLPPFLQFNGWSDPIGEVDGKFLFDSHRKALQSARVLLAPGAPYPDSPAEAPAHRALANQVLKGSRATSSLLLFMQLHIGCGVFLPLQQIILLDELQFSHPFCCSWRADMG